MMLFVFGSVLLVYFVSIPPSVPGGDSGELLAEACQLGTAHPPGYPLFTMLMHPVLRWLPTVPALGIASPAAWANMACAVCGAAAAAVIANIVRDISVVVFDRRYPPSCAAAAALFAFSPLVWQYSTTTEVFALNNLLCALIIRNAVGFALHGQYSFVRKGAVICGLALSNQHTAILFVVPMVAWMLTLVEPSEIWRLASLFLIGLAPYAYLPLHISKPGEWGDVSTFQGFVHHFLRRDYGTLRLYSGKASSSEDLVQRLAAYAGDVANRQSNPQKLLPLLALVGFAALCFFTKATSILPSDTTRASPSAKDEKAHRGRGKNGNKNAAPSTRQTSRSGFEISVALATTLLFYLLVFHSLSNLPLSDPLLFGIHSRFWMQPNILVCVAAGLGLLWLPGNQALAVLLVALQLKNGAPAAWSTLVMEKRPNWHFSDYSKALLAPLPQNSLLLVNYDQQWTSTRYTQVCENFRPDVTVLQLSMMTYGWWEKKRHLYPSVSWPGTHYTKENTVAWAEGAFTIKEFLEANYDSYPMFLGGKLSFADQGYKSSFEFVPHGLVSRVYRTGDTPSLKLYTAQSRSVWKRTLEHIRRLPFEEEGYSQESWEWTITRETFTHVAERASYILERAIEMPETEKGRLRYLFEAAQWLEYCLQYDAYVPTHIVKNSGLADVHIVRSAPSSSSRKPFATKLPDILGDRLVLSPNMQRFADLHPNATGDEWKTWASERFTKAWGDFLQRSDASEDPQYETIRGIYEKVVLKSSS